MGGGRRRGEGRAGERRWEGGDGREEMGGRRWEGGDRRREVEEGDSKRRREEEKGIHFQNRREVAWKKTTHLVS